VAAVDEVATLLLIAQDPRVTLQAAVPSLVVPSAPLARLKVSAIPEAKKRTHWDPLLIHPEVARTHEESFLTKTEGAERQEPSDLTWIPIRYASVFSHTSPSEPTPEVGSLVEMVMFLTTDWETDAVVTEPLVRDTELGADVAVAAVPLMSIA